MAGTEDAVVRILRNIQATLTQIETRLDRVESKIDTLVERVETIEGYLTYTMGETLQKRPTSSRSRPT